MWVRGGCVLKKNVVQGVASCQMLLSGEVKGGRKLATSFGWMRCVDDLY